MMFLIRNLEDLQKLNEAFSLKSQVMVVRLQDKLGEQNYHQNAEKLYKPVTDTIENTSENLTKTITESSFLNNEALNDINNKLLEIMNDRGILASYLMTPLSKITNPENTSQFKLVKDQNSNRVNDLLIKNTIPINLHNNFLTFRDTGKVFELKGDLLKMITNKNYNVNLASLQDKKLMYDFAEEMNFDTKAQGRKSTRHNTLIRLLKSPAIMGSGKTTKHLSENPDELCDRLKLLLQEIQAGNNSDIIMEEIIAIVDKLLEYKCTSKKQHKQTLIKYNLSTKYR